MASSNIIQRSDLQTAMADLEELDAGARRLVLELISLLRRTRATTVLAGQQHTLLELQGLGKEIWTDESADEYVRGERASWKR